jgi:uncharacterized protein YlxP (DUF503 family)
VVVGVLKLRLQLFDSHSLKEKRRVVKSLVERTKSRFNVAVAEVADNDIHDRAVIGLVTVANDGPFVNSVLDQAKNQIADDAIGKAEIIEETLAVEHY